MKKRVLKTFARLLIIAVGLYAILAVLAMFFEEKFIFFPDTYPTGNWTLPSGAEDVFITTSDKVELHAWWIPNEKASHTFLWLHGNAGNITHRKYILEHLKTLGINILMLDYRGYGRSEGIPSEKGLYTDAEAAHDFLVNTKNISPRSIIVFAQSLGTPVGAELMLRRECGGAILEAPFTSAKEMAMKIIPIPLGWAIKSEFDTLSKIKKINKPILIVHGTADSVVPFEHGKRVFESANAPKTFIELPNIGHNDQWENANKKYLESIITFLKLLN